MKTILIICSICIIQLAYAQSAFTIETSDIDRFWNAVDKLQTANNYADSIAIIQTEYLDKASAGLQKFIRVRELKAPYYIYLLNRYPAFWESVRPLTLHIVNRKAEIETVMQKLQEVLPGFSPPDICFAIGKLNTGGTTASGMILIGAEISASDNSVNKTEMSGWLYNIIGNTGDIVSMVAHEAVHTNQKFALKFDLLHRSMREGVADFIPLYFLGFNINAKVHTYGQAHACSLWEEFQTEMHKNDISKWLYNGNSAVDRPADLGYYIGASIAEAYYLQAENKTKALQTLMKSGKAKKVLKNSKYNPCTK